MITKQEVLDAQELWANALVKIGSLKDNSEKCYSMTESLLKDLYAFEKGEILFKPTKAYINSSRPSLESAISYFIGGNPKYIEDKGFALTPWVHVRFDNKHFIFEERRAMVMGHYFFTDKKGDIIKVEYTFGYYKNGSNRLKVDLHHSSLPFNPD